MKLKIHETNEVNEMNEMNERNERNEWLIDWNACMHEWINQSMNQRNLPTSSSKSAPNMSVFFTIFMWNRARAHLCEIELVHIWPTSSSKSPPNASVFTFFMINRALATVLRTFCRQLLQIEARNCGNRDPTSATTEATLPEKTQAFAPESLFKPELAHSDLLRFPTMTCWCGWHDDVVDMMVRMLPMTIVCNSDVF